MEKEFITLENGLDYMIINEKNNYLFLASIDNNSDVCIRKVVEDKVVGLYDENELSMAMNLFIK